MTHFSPDCPSPTCPECGATLKDNLTCEDHFHQMLYWENEFPGHGVVHHLTVLCYYLQHPSLYSPDGLRYGLGLLVEFVENQVSPQEIRQKSRSQVDSGQRGWKVTSRSGQKGAYSHPVDWTMTARDVTAPGAEHYIESVRRWANRVFQDLKQSKNL